MKVIDARVKKRKLIYYNIIKAKMLKSKLPKGIADEGIFLRNYLVCESVSRF